MFYYALLFLVVTILAAVLGFYALAGTAALVAKVLFLIFLVLFIAGLLRERGPTV